MSAIVLNPDYPEDGSGFETISAITKHCHFRSKLLHYSTISYFMFHSVPSRANTITSCSNWKYRITGNIGSLYVWWFGPRQGVKIYWRDLNLAVWPKTGHKNILEEFKLGSGALPVCNCDRNMSK